MKKVLATLLSAVAFVACGFSVQAAKLPETFETTAVDRYLAELVREKKFVGLSVSVMRDGQVILEKAYGQKSLEPTRPARPDTLFAIGSVSKQFTCAAVFLLAEEGKLSVHDPVAKYYPDLTRAADITLLDLMQHVSGYPDYYPLDFVERPMQNPIDPDELLRQFAGGKLDFEPGTKYSYSNTGYILLGRVVEKVSGQDFGSFLQKRIFEPLAMHQTLYEPSQDNSRMATGYARFVLSGPEAARPEGQGWIGAAGGIYSTPGDLARWNLALISGKVLQPESYKLMTTPRILKDGRRSDYGGGLALVTRGGRELLEHTGAVSGFNAYNGVIPGTRSSVSVCVNLDSGAPALGRELLNLLLKVPEIIPDISGPTAPEAAKALFLQYQSGKLNRSDFTDEFNHFLTDEKIKAAAGRLGRYGKPRGAELLTRSERGGMEVTTVRLEFPSGDLRTLMYRHPNGKIAQFFLYEH